MKKVFLLGNLKDIEEIENLDRFEKIFQYPIEYSVDSPYELGMIRIDNICFKILLWSQPERLNPEDGYKSVILK